MFEKTWLVEAVSIGISHNDFWDMSPRTIKLISEGYKRRIQRIDNLIWTWFGNYGLSSVFVAVEHNLAGKKARSEYIKEPILSKQIKEEKDYFTDKDIEMAIMTEKMYMARAINAGLPETIVKF